MRNISKAWRILIAERARHRCEYCGIHEKDTFFDFEVDHIISLKHGGKTELDNLAHSCFPCNNNKGSDIATVLLPSKTPVRLFNPREDVWSEHFEMENGSIYGKTPIGDATLKLLKFNEIDRIIERQAVM